MSAKPANSFAFCHEYVRTPPSHCRCWFLRTPPPSLPTTIAPLPPPLLRTTPSSPAVAATSLEDAVVTAAAASPHAAASLLRLIPHRFSARRHRHGHRVSSDNRSHHHCHCRFLCTLPPPAVFLLVIISQCVCQLRRCSRKITRGQSDE